MLSSFSKWKTWQTMLLWHFSGIVHPTKMDNLHCSFWSSKIFQISVCTVSQGNAGSHHTTFSVAAWKWKSSMLVMQSRRETEYMSLKTLTPELDRCAKHLFQLSRKLICRHACSFISTQRFCLILTWNVSCYHAILTCVVIYSYSTTSS